ncbi:hypothetical protein SAMN05192560_1524 [Methylobacillus rhizosphaerae]|uniref:Uncharacterized protein n=1 Tax=Methylobacillus rhizosphaerae TaxID=551994 RepID=A0A238ZX65_9PROT|nr:hypothetical protein [Methylobacillus rhizosphaerae]SNR87591.1 hypothetical protein SAMN05192560_1524 [Methylobacillus rhizosphaerae]
MSRSKLFVMVLVLILVWVAFTQIRMLDGKGIDAAKAAALQQIENPETAKFENLQEVQHGKMSVVCGQYLVKDADGNYGYPRDFVVEIYQDEEPRFSEAGNDVAQYCHVSGDAS